MGTVDSSSRSIGRHTPYPAVRHAKSLLFNDARNRVRSVLTTFALLNAKLTGPGSIPPTTQAAALGAYVSQSSVTFLPSSNTYTPYVRRFGGPETWPLE
jgi:hypothetical protein